MVSSADFYQRKWWFIKKVMQVDKTHCIHHGLYKRGVHSNTEAVNALNDLVGGLLGLDAQEGALKMVLDLGCGIGGVSVDLAQKFHDVRFVGVTNVVKHCTLGKGFAQKEGVSTRVDFCVGDFIDMGFCSNSFDAVFLVESLVYALDPRLLIHEVYRILKPGGRLVIVDMFRHGDIESWMLQRVFRCFCDCWALSGVCERIAFLEVLKQEKFRILMVRDLTKNVALGIIWGSICGLPYLMMLVSKKVMRGKSFLISDNPMFLALESIFCMILGLANKIKYSAVAAIKGSF